MRRNKYNNVITTYRGHVFDSRKEAEYAMYLDSEIARGIIKKWTTHHKFEIVVKDKKICTYIADFVVEHVSGMNEVVDVKSIATITSTFRLKWKLVQAIWGHKYKFTIAK